ncbi:AraC family transcriptional regulator [Pseudarthrobacter oxydans]|uniref:AraC family transcriptional regulator n=1 Tax=Pseudarthrobacter oxydans TaxID=1671 RepID=UPI0035EC82EB|nr:AraC family transcriptional regulator [Pseudarthrobacter oxydans]
MHTVQSAPASQALRPFVRAFAQRTVTGVVQAQSMPPFLETVINFDFVDLPTVLSVKGGVESVRALALVGPHTHAGTSLRFEGSIDSFAIFLQPAALWSLFRVPTSVVMETHFDAEDVLGAAVAELWHVLAETPEFVDRIRAAEMFILRAANFELKETPTTAAASLLARRGGQISIHDLASGMNVSIRQLERSFLREIGIPPKRFARVARFQAALDARVGRPDRSWLNIAIDSGYHDQMHLVHEFQSIAGLSPVSIIEQLGDSRPAALVASQGWDR